MVIGIHEVMPLVMVAVVTTEELLVNVLTLQEVVPPVVQSGPLPPLRQVVEQPGPLPPLHCGRPVVEQPGPDPPFSQLVVQSGPLPPLVQCPLVVQSGPLPPLVQ